MKKLSLLLGWICYALLGHSQPTINVTGTIIDTSGMAVPGVEVQLVVLETEGPVTSFLTTDANGNYSTSLTLGENDPGSSCVQISYTDCNGGMPFEIQCFFGNDTTFKQNFVYCSSGFTAECDAYLIESAAPGNQVELVTQALGTPPFTYNWSNGAVTEDITVAPDGTEYCVTVTDALGCVSEVCRAPANPCQLHIQRAFSGDSLFLFGQSAGQGPFGYEWSTGDTSQFLLLESGGTYCLTLTDATGCQSTGCATVSDSLLNGCFASIFNVHNASGQEALAVSAFASPPLTYLWSSGETTDTIVPVASGTYCVTVTDSEGCTATDCQVFHFSDTCAISLFGYHSGGGTYTFLSDAQGQGTLSYSWSTGDTTEQITVASAGEYCLTVTDENGCVATACDTAFLAVPCALTVEIEGVDTLENTIVLQALPAPSGNYQYNWGTPNGGTATGSTLAATEAGSYCVTVTDAANTCSATNCVSVSFSENGSGTSTGGLSGALRDTVNGGLVPGNLLLFQEDAAGAFEVIAEVPAPSGFFIFSGLEEGIYYLLGEPQDTAAFLPTYFEGTPFSAEAVPIEIVGGQQTQAIVHMLPITPPAAGSGKISGIVSTDIVFLNEGPSNTRAPISGANIMVMREGMEAAAQRYTESDGGFAFQGLPFGAYTVYLEIPGHSPWSEEVVLTPEAPNATGLDFDGSVTRSQEQQLAPPSLSVAPNPVSNWLTVRIPEGITTSVNWALVNVSGQRLLAGQASASPFELNLSDLPAGLYLLSVEAQSGPLVVKILKR